MENELKNNINPSYDLKRKIIECAKNHKLLGLDKDLVERLEKDYFELCEFQRHYSTTRWTITSFFILLSFAGCGYILQTGDKPRWMAICGLWTSVLLYWTAIFLHWRRDRLTHAIRVYLETLGPILGIYTNTHLNQYM